MSRSKLLFGNWKMNHGPKATHEYFQALKTKLEPMRARAITGTLSFSAKSVGLFVPTLCLHQALQDAAELKSSLHAVGQTTSPRNLQELHVGAQLAHWAPNGAFTGETSGPMLKEIGIGWVLVGHSERRQFFGETDQTVHRRALSLLEQGFSVMVCIGETLGEREAGQTAAVLSRQVDGFLGGRELAARFAPHLARLSLAYEPVWAIGTGQTATPEQAEEAHEHIRALLESFLGPNEIAIAYGGSVTPENFAELLRKPSIDGGLVGGASLKVDSFTTLIDILGRT